ncbi:class I SAM-dependent RNA methyltransferase [Pseudomonadota bacterium]
MSRPPKRKRHGAPKRRQKRLPSSTVEVTVDRLGAQGDGVADWNGQALYIPGVLPGETVRALTGQKRGDGLAAELLDVLEASPQRIDPICPHYATCGGCAMQHMDTQAYSDWKRGKVARALAQRGFDDAEVLAPVLVGPGTRRRVTFSAQRRGKRAHLGFNARASHDLVAVDACPLVTDDINAAIAPLRDVLAQVLDDNARARVAMTSCANGLDVLIEGGDAPGLPAREALATFVSDKHAARVAWKEEKYAPEPVAQTAAPMIDLSGMQVELPMGAFLQASVEGEHAIRDQVLVGVGDAKTIADLYCGLGSFTVPLARKAIVHAYDLTEAPVRALSRAAGRSELGGRVKAEVRDLDRQAFDAQELSNFDAVVFDPPRAGAAEQVTYLADADVERVVAVSCNPATFARDARTLVDGGFRLVDVLPIDQFTFSGHVELVARFTRD